MGFLALLCESVATVLPLHFTKDKLKYNDISRTEFKADPILAGWLSRRAFSQRKRAYSHSKNVACAALCKSTF